ncbi:N-acetylglucosamine/diacetylchitobiose ABC transporter substrate-binding protein [Kribbella sp. GL6]|uniref:N-acetylglucosamine/diacetylchitobiose ABC transporter substrate-binding protein n=1 Tax=Kribbella sp. GL6 TaxID=3419765 RepID=UPI003CFC84D1
MPPIDRRTLLLGLAGGTGLLLTGCAVPSGGKDGGQKADPTVAGSDPKNPFGVKASDPLDVVIFKGGFGDDYAKAVEETYKQAFPGADVKHSGLQKLQETLQPRFVSGHPPDVIDNSGASALNGVTLQKGGQLLDLKALLDAPSVDDPKVLVRDTLLPGVIESGTLGDIVASVNYAFTVGGFWYNQDLFEKNGWEYPKTWDELLALCARIKASGMAPFTYQGKFPGYFLEPLMQMMARTGGEQTMAAVDNLEPGAWQSQPVADAAGAIEKLVKNGYILQGSEGLSHTEAQQAWVDGKAALIPCGSWLENEMKSTTPKGFRMAVGPTPAVTAQDKLPATAISASSSEGFIVPKDGKNTAGGLEFLRLLLSKQAASKFSELTGSMTTVKGAGADVTNSPALTSARKAVEAAGKDTIAFRFGGWYGDLYTAGSTAMGELLTGRIDAAGFMKRTQAAADKVAKDSNVVKYHR